MASNRVKEIGIDAGMASTRGKSNDVKHTLRSSNNNRTYDINMPGLLRWESGRHVTCGSWVQSPLQSKILKALGCWLHVKFPCSYVQNGLYLTEI